MTPPHFTHALPIAPEESCDNVHTAHLHMTRLFQCTSTTNARRLVLAAAAAGLSLPQQPALAQALSTKRVTWGPFKGRSDAELWITAAE